MKMKAWQIFALGTIAAVLLFSLHAYESALAGLAAIGIVAAVIVGFCLYPRTNTFYLRTTARVPRPDYSVVVEHDHIAVRVELARLWLLFVPTFTAVAFLLVTAANGTTWKMNSIDSALVRLLNLGPYPVVLFFRFLVFGVFILLSAWINERWILRDATACSAGSIHKYKNRIMYSFQDPSGEYYGGQGIPLGSTRSPELQTIVFYKTHKPEISTIAMCRLFHRVLMVGRGLTDLDEATDAVAMKMQAASQTL